MDRQLFEKMYQGRAPWDTGRPQPAIVNLAEAGQIRGSVLDVGCGTGENVLYLAAKGHDSWGLDFLPLVIERANAKAAQRGIDAHFIVGDALELARLGRQFDTVIDCGLFHTFADEERPVFVEGLTKVLGREDSCIFSASQTRNREPRDRGELASRKSEMPSKMDGLSRRSSQPALSRLKCRAG